MSPNIPPIRLAHVRSPRELVDSLATAAIRDGIRASLSGIAEAITEELWNTSDPGERRAYVKVRTLCEKWVNALGEKR